MHESSPRPVFGRERNDGWKTASVEGMGSGFKVARFGGFKDRELLQRVRTDALVPSDRETLEPMKV
jgi:hypothetical protein